MHYIQHVKAQKYLQKKSQVKDLCGIEPLACPCLAVSKRDSPDMHTFHTSGSPVDRSELEILIFCCEFPKSHDRARGKLSRRVRREERGECRVR
jgi:hypothetical protein